MFHIHWSFDRYWIYKMYLCECESEIRWQLAKTCYCACHIDDDRES